MARGPFAGGPAQTALHNRPRSGCGIPAENRRPRSRSEPPAGCALQERLSKLDCLEPLSARRLSAGAQCDRRVRCVDRAEISGGDFRARRYSLIFSSFFFLSSASPRRRSPQASQIVFGEGFPQSLHTGFPLSVMAFSPRAPLTAESHNET